jgi:hypothetical protein
LRHITGSLKSAEQYCAANVMYSQAIPVQKASRRSDETKSMAKGRGTSGLSEARRDLEELPIIFLEQAGRLVHLPVRQIIEGCFPRK